MVAWVEGWLPESLRARCRGRGAEERWLCTAVEAQAAKLDGRGFIGAAIDLRKALAELSMP
eukprot:13402443-Alexandrium_andersonii.AAC.1